MGKNTPRAEVLSRTKSYGRRRQPGPTSAPFVPKTGLAERLCEAIPSRNWSEISRRIHAGGAHADDVSVARYFRGERTPGTEVLQVLARIGNCTIDWLLEGRGPRRPATGRTRDDQAPYRLAIVGAAAADSSGGRLVDLEAPEGWYDIPRDCAVVEVVGESLAPVALHGQKLVIAGPGREPAEGDLVVLETEDGRVFAKRYSDASDGGPIVLTSVNPVDRIPPVRIPRDEVRQVRVIVGVHFE